MSARTLVEHIKASVSHGDPATVLAAVDAAAESHGLMHVGPEKGAILDALVADAAPRRILELGAYFGYTAVRMARYLPTGGELVSIDADADHVALTQDLVDCAGLADAVTVHHGTAQEALPTLDGQFDFVLIDHYASNYHDDLRLIESLGLLAPNAVVAADNAVMHAGEMADYLAYVRTGGAYDSELLVADVAHHGGTADGIEVSRRRAT